MSGAGGHVLDQERVSPAPSSAVASRAEPEAPVPHRARVASFAVTGLFLLACFYTLFLARELLMPIVAALVFFVFLMPVVRWLSKWRIPAPVSSAAIVFGVLAMALFSVYAAADPIAKWRQRAPSVMSEVEAKLRGIKESVEDVQKATKEVEKIAETVAGQANKPPEVTIKTPSLVERLLGGLQALGVQLGIFLVLLYFLLASGEIFTEKVAKVLPTLRDKKLALTIARQVEREVSTYILTITIINAIFGLAIGVSLYFLGVPNAFLWGAMAGVLNFVPYIGAIVGATIIGIVGLVSVDSVAEALVAPAIYMALNVLESQFITPSILGRRFTLNPVVIFITVIVWSWMWGVPGGLLAVPLLVILKALCDHIEALNNFGEFLRGRES